MTSKTMTMTQTTVTNRTNMNMNMTSIANMISSNSMSNDSAAEALAELSRNSQAAALRMAQELLSNSNSNSNANTNTNHDSINTTQQDNSSSNAKSNVQINMNIINNKSNPNNISILNSKSPNNINTQKTLETCTSCTESILNSLTKVASGGSAASSELRQLEEQRRIMDSATADVQTALLLRSFASHASDALGAKRYLDAAKAIQSFHTLHPTDRAKVIAGPHSLQTLVRSRDVLQRTILSKYEMAIEEQDLKSLSELTPLLGMLQLADKGVGYYLQYSQTNLNTILSQQLEQDTELERKQKIRQEEETLGVALSRAELARRKKEELSTGHITICTKLAKIYNVAVTHLRHHLPMVTYALGDADGDAALVQLVHVEVEKRVSQLMREYVVMKRLPQLQTKANGVAALIEERYRNGGGMGENEDLMYEEDDLFVFSNNESVGGASSASSTGGKLHFRFLGTDIGSTASATNSNNAIDSSLIQNKNIILDKLNDCGFKQELGSFSEVNASMDELALLLQHSESYERFLRHAVEEVNKARAVRKKQAREERKRQVMLELENTGRLDRMREEMEAFDLKEKEFESSSVVMDQPILPPHTQLNEIVAEIGGYYSGLERTFLLASMQRAFLNASYPDSRNYSPLTTINVSSSTDGVNPTRSSMMDVSVGYDALQSSIVEECLYAAQRSTLRAFATGHTGTAAAAANFCSDILSTVFLEVLSSRADVGISMLKPGDGLLPGSAGLGQAALAIMSSAQKGLVSGGNRNREKEERKNREWIEMCISRACANLNDLEVAMDYTRRLELKCLQEMESTFPLGKKETEQLRMCIKSISSVTEACTNASNEAIEQLINIIMPRVRSIVNESVGQDSTTGTGFGNLGGGVTVMNTVKMNYHLDDAAYQMSQLSEGYISKLCNSLDELVGPLRRYLSPRLFDSFFIGVLGGSCKRLEASFKRTQFTTLGALALDSDIRYFMNYAKDQFDSSDLSSNVTLYKACNPLSRLAQIALLMNVDDLEDALDLISISKRKKMWDLSLNDAKAFLNLRVDFEGRKVNELLKVPDE